jgi:hypothetical protein
MPEDALAKNGQSVQVFTPEPDAYFYVPPGFARKMLKSGEAVRVSDKVFALQLVWESEEVSKQRRLARWTNVSGSGGCDKRLGYSMNGIAINRTGRNDGRKK